MSNSYYRDIWNYKNADYDKLNNFIFQFDWDSVINDNVTVDDACNKFTSIFFEFCKECIPRKKVLIRPNDKPWFNSELRYNIRLRDRLRKKAFKTNNNFDKIRYKRQRNRVNNMKKNAKENFNDTIDDILSNSETGSKSRKENPQKPTQLSSRSHPRHLVGKKDSTKDTIIDITSDSQVNSNFPNRWSQASLTFNNYFYLFLYLYIT